MTGIETTIVTALTNNFIGQMIKSGWEGINKNELLTKDVGQLFKEGKYLFFAGIYSTLLGSARHD